jgi:LuxR family transcriptional regulator, quorum-sensing system regulator BjaR1
VFASSNVTKQGNLELAAFICNCSTEFDLSRACATVGERHDLPFFSIARLPEHGESRLSELALASNWPVALIRQYDELGMLENNPVIDALRRSTAPVLWDSELIERQRGGDAGQLARNLLEKYRMQRGVYFGVHSATGLRGAVSFAGSRGPLRQEELMDLSYHAMLIFDRLCILSEVDRSDGPTLSRRERECIVWTSHGKTSYEIGVILGLSEHTINNYLANVCRKLGAMNRAHLVGIVLRQKLIQ